MLYNKDFLLKLDKSKNKTIYARITALTFEESPIETIEGRVTGGSINLDGASALRRSCSLTMVAQDFNYNEFYWGLNTKFKLEIGVQNLVDPKMPDIIWFNQGIYLITTFNTSRSTTNFTISINGKDKMCLLNGEVGGALESSVDFGCIEEEDKNGMWTIRKLPIQDIIRNAVHTYAGEPYWNIIINDLDTYGLELLEYRYDTPMYLYRDPSSNIFYNVIMENDNTVVEVNGQKVKLKEIPPSHLDVLVESLVGAEEDPETVVVNGKEYIFAKVEYGNTVGYRVTDLVYPGDLIANIGESITSVLDKIKNMLSEFEYFYDIDGRFVFQKKQSFIETMWTPLKEGTENEMLDASIANLNSNKYIFSGGELITAFNNNPNLLNLRNDYSIWGQRTGASGAAIPVHMRYAIDTKPISYTQITVNKVNDLKQIEKYNEKHGTTLQGRSAAEVKTFTNEKYDWREVIYQMAVDYYKYNILDNFEILLREANPQYFTGQTGYEKYYIDLQGFWRQLYNPTFDENISSKTADIEITNASINSLRNEITALENVLKADGNPNGTARQELVSKESELNHLLVFLDNLNIDLEKLTNQKDDYYDSQYEDVEKRYWNKNVFEHPELLNFWFDFLDSNGELQQFNVKNIGSRSKSINDSNIKSIYFRDTPAVVFTEDITKENQLTGYRYIQIPSNLMDTMFNISAQGKSAKDRLDELIYQHGYCIESATITAIPVYYLEPNTRIYIYDEDTGLDGDYIVSKITLPLTYNGTMSITSTKAAQSLY